MSLHYDVVDGDVNEFDKKANEAHDSKTNSSGKGNLLKFCKKMRWFTVMPRNENASCGLRQGVYYASEIGEFSVYYAEFSD